MAFYYFILAFMLFANDSTKVETASESELQRKKKEKVLFHQKRCIEIQNEKKIKKEERENALKIMSRHRMNCNQYKYTYHYKDYEKFDEYVNNLENSKELFDARNQEHNNVRSFTKEQLNRKWKMVGLMLCSRDCQHNINCDECGGDGLCKNCLTDDNDHHNGMCHNWFINGYTTTELKPYNFLKD